MSPAAKREVVRYTVKQYNLSQRRACRTLKVPRSTIRYLIQKSNDESLREKLKDLASKRRRFGSPRLITMLKREGFKDNHKRIERIYAEGRTSSEKKKEETPNSSPKNCDANTD